MKSFFDDKIVGDLMYKYYDAGITCSFTGHRPSKFSFGYNENDSVCEKLKFNIRKAVESLIIKGYINFQSGLAQGVDTYCAEIVLDMKAEYPHIKLVGAIPCYEQDALWSAQAKERYNKLKCACDITHYLTKSTYTKGCMQIRNRFLVESAGILLAVYDGSPGGTRNTVDYAMKLNKKLIIIDPSNDTKMSFYSQETLF